MPKPFAMPDPKATGWGVADYESQLVCARSGLVLFVMCWTCVLKVMSDALDLALNGRVL